MNRAGAFAMALIIVLWAVTPALACLLPGQQMTTAEEECCQKMAQQCGSAMKPSSHTCCHHPDQQETAVSTATKYSPTRLFNVAVVPQATIVSMDSALIPARSQTVEAARREASPGCRSILRI